MSKEIARELRELADRLERPSVWARVDGQNCIAFRTSVEIPKDLVADDHIIGPTARAFRAVLSANWTRIKIVRDEG